MSLRSILFALLVSVPPGAIADDCKVVDPELQDYYKGGCRNGLAHGKGYARGTAEYEGGFRKGLKHGQGVKTWPWGDRYEGEFVADRLAGKQPHAVNYDLVPGATYSDPEVASVGLTEKAAKERGYKLKIGTFPFSANGKARILNLAEGMAKVVAEEQYDEVLGVHIVGPRATELISDACSLLRLETTSEEMLHVMRPHPTLSEVLTEAALGVRGKPIHI